LYHSESGGDHYCVPAAAAALLCKFLAEQFCDIQYGNLEFTGFLCLFQIFNADRTGCYQSICSACYGFFNSLSAGGSAASGIHAVALHFHKLEPGDGSENFAGRVIEAAVPAEAAVVMIGYLHFGS
jgi:hypothetical protein